MTIANQQLLERAGSPARVPREAPYPHPSESEAFARVLDTHERDHV
jgi:hypothetical protein